MRRKRRCRFLVWIAAVGVGYKLKEHLALDVKVRYDTTMAGFDGDLEKAFTNGDPEAVLDFLALRSHQMQHGEDEEDPACSVPLFTTDNDMAAFVRDLTIDDAISLCFADLPSGYDDTMMSSTPVAMPSVPEQKLADPTLAAGCVPAHKQPSDANRRPAAHRDTPAGECLPQSSSRHSRGKPRGFLSSLLGRGHKGRRGGSHRKPPPHQNDASSKPTDPPASSTFSLEEDLKKTSAASESSANARQHHYVPAGWKPELLLDGSSDYPNQVVAGKQEKPDVKQKHLDILQLGDTNVEQVTYDTDPVGLIEFCFQHPDPNRLGTVEHRLEPTAPHSDHHAMAKAVVQSGHVVIDHAHNRSTECSEAMMSSSRCTNRPKRNDLPVSLHSHARSDLGLPPKHTEKHGSRQPMAQTGHSPDRIRQDRPAVLPSQTLLQTSKCPAAEKNAKLHPAGQVQFPQMQQGETDQTAPAQKPWEGLCDGIDAFIDFERDPNVEVPLDSRLSAQFHFERRASETCSQANGEHDDVLGSKLLATEGSEAAHVTLQAPAVVPAERMSRPGDGQRVPQTALAAAAPNCASSLQNAPLCSPVPQLTPSKMSTSTQTEKADSEPWERSIPKVGQCLRTVITQLCSLSACSSCQDGTSKILAALKKVLMEVEAAGVPPETDAVPQGQDSTGQSLPRGHSVTCSTDKQTDSGLSDGAAADHTSEGSPPRHADRKKTDGPGKCRGHDSKSGPQGHRRPQQSHREAGANSKTSMSGKHPEHSSKRSKASGSGKKQTTSSRASVPSDSDSTSTVTSEPITVLSCQRGNRSSSESSKAGHVNDQAVTADRPLNADTGGDTTARSELPASRSSSRMDSGPTPASDLHAATELSAMHSAPAVETALIATATSRHRKDSRSTRSSSRYTGEADRDYESFMTSSWSEMTSVSSVSDVVTSADESSYYSGDDDNDDEEDEDEDEGNDMMAVVRLGLLDEDRDETELRHHRLQRHLAAVLRQSSIPSTTVETVVAATGERLNSQERHVSHVNQGAMYPFSSRDSCPALPGQEESATRAALSAPVARPKEGHTPVAGLHPSTSAASTGREARSVRKAKKGGGGVPRLFSPDRQVSLVSARQMTSEEFREGYDRSTDITKVKRSQLDGDIPWDLIPCSDTDDDAGSDKAWYNVTSEEESLAQAYCSDTDSSTTVSDW